MTNKPKVAIIDYGMGNLFSVKHACESVNIEGHITFSKKDILSADAVILPGVGAFGNAMKNLEKLDLIDIIRKMTNSSKPFMGICLGMQLLMDESYEFDHCQGLGIIKGSVIHFNSAANALSKSLKVPHIGWNKIYKKDCADELFSDSMLKGERNGEFMYFVHSFYVDVREKDVILSRSKYGDIEFCSAISKKNIFACQFHPERSGPRGLEIYDNLAHLIP